MNLALVYHAFFDKDHHAGHLDEALVDDALEEYRTPNATSYFEEAQRLREYILAAKDKL